MLVNTDSMWTEDKGGEQKYNDNAVYKGIDCELELKGGHTIMEKAGAEAARRCIGGLQNTGDTVKRLGAVREFGKKLRLKLEDCIEAVEGFEDKCLGLIGLPNKELEVALSEVKPGFDKVKAMVSKFLGVANTPKNQMPTEIDAAILRAWATQA